MGLFEQFPYTNFHELNLDWVLNNTKTAIDKVDRFNDDVLRFTTEIDEFDKKINGFEKQIDNMDVYIHETAADSATKTAKEVAPAAAAAEVQKMYADGRIALPYDITNHGADKTGQNDCTSIINNVLNMYNVAFIPNGLYKIDGSITIHTGQMLVGESSISTILQCNNNGVLSSTYQKNTGTGNVDADYGFTISSIHFTGVTGFTCMLLYAYHFNILDCVIEKFTNGIISEYNKNTGFTPAGTTMEAVVENCLLQRNSNNAIDWKGPSDSRIVNCILSNGKNGIIAESVETSWANGLSIVGCHGYKFIDGNFITAKAPIQVYNTLIESCTIGIAINVPSVIIQGCYIYNIYSYPVHISADRLITIADTVISVGSGNYILYAVNKITDSYFSIITHGSSEYVVNDNDQFDYETVVLNIYNPLNTKTISRSKAPSYLYQETVLADTFYTASKTNTTIVYLRTAGTVNIEGSYNLGTQTVFLVGPGQKWKTDTATIAYYQTLY